MCYKDVFQRYKDSNLDTQKEEKETNIPKTHIREQSSWHPHNKHIVSDIDII